MRLSHFPGKRDERHSYAKSSPCRGPAWYNPGMRISLFLLLTGIFALWPRKLSGVAKRRPLNVEDAVRLWAEHGAVF